MPFIRIRRPWQMPQSLVTPESVHRTRREFLKQAGVAGLAVTGLAAGLVRSGAGAPAAGAAPPAIGGASPLSGLLPAKTNPRYGLDRPVTAEILSTRNNNFYEFTENKGQVWQLVDGYQPWPWKVDITGLVEKPLTLDLGDLVKRMPLEERLYRHRCVEAWAMAVPWTGFPMKALIDLARPLSAATHVRMVSFLRPDQAPNQKTATWYPWPYYEGLTMAEATNELTFLAVGLYGKDLPRQNGAPIRLVTPWKYGYKSIKSIVKIEFTDRQPRTFWNDLAPNEYGFVSNVDPTRPHPRWSQATESVLGESARRPTLPFNGYGEFVAGLYRK